MGTPATWSPEIAKGEEYDEGCDIWALGVSYNFLCAQVWPFPLGPSLLQSIMSPEIWPEPLPETFSPEMQHLASRMLDKEQRTRPCSGQLLLHLAGITLVVRYSPNRIIDIGHNKENVWFHFPTKDFLKE